MSGEAIQLIGAFLSGMGSVLTGWLALRYERKRSAEECAERIKAFREGIRLRDAVDQGRPLSDELSP